MTLALLAKEAHEGPVDGGGFPLVLVMGIAVDTERKYVSAAEQHSWALGAR